MSKRSLLYLLPLGLACLGIGAAHDPPGAAQAEKKDGADRPEDTKAIRALDEAFTQAYNKGDAKALAALFSDDAEVTNESGDTIRGRDAIVEHFSGVFEASPGEKIELTTESIRFLGADVARVTGHARTTPADNEAAEATLYRAILVKHDGKWLHAVVEESAEARPPSPHDRLKELEWLVGEWVDESEDAVVHTTCRWSEDGSYLLRDFTMQVAGRPVLKGSQRIGWDPRRREFKSWVFDADGGHGEGFWDRVGKDQWVIRASGVTADGRDVEATQIITYVNKHLMRWHSVDRTIGGQPVPDLDEIVLVRTPPKPADSPNTNNTRKP